MAPIIIIYFIKFFDLKPINQNIYYKKENQNIDNIIYNMSFGLNLENY